MFLTTGSIGQAHAIIGIVNATVKRTLAADEITAIDDFDELYEQAKMQLADLTTAAQGDGVVDVRFSPEVVNVEVGPKFLVLHAYGTAVSLLDQN